MHKLVKQGLLVLLVLVVGFIVVGTVAGYLSYQGIRNIDEAAQDRWELLEVHFDERVRIIVELVGEIQDAATIPQEALFASIGDARGRYGDLDATQAGKIEAAKDLEADVQLLVGVLQTYPRVASDAGVQELLGRLNRNAALVLDSAQQYNDAAQAFNISISRGLTKAMLPILGFEERPLYGVIEE